MALALTDEDTQRRQVLWLSTSSTLRFEYDAAMPEINKVWLQELVELEYLESEATKQGKPARYVLSARAPKQELVLGLLSPEELRHFATTSPRAVAGS